MSAPVSPLDLCLQDLLQRDDYTIVQIGAYVGASGTDPLYPRLRQQACIPGKPVRRRVILVEPVREYYERLKANYQGLPGVCFENVAISDRAGPATLYRLGVDPVAYGYPEWLSQLGSLKEERMHRLWDRYEGNPEIKRFFLMHRIAETVLCITFQDLIERHSLDRIDLLQMDVEGYEYEIFRTMDFRTVHPRFINYESVLLHERKADCERLLRAQGYDLLEHGQDTLCYTAHDRPLLARWRSLPSGGSWTFTSTTCG